MMSSTIAPATMKSSPFNRFLISAISARIACTISRVTASYVEEGRTSTPCPFRYSRTAPFNASSLMRSLRSETADGSW